MSQESIFQPKSGNSKASKVSEYKVSEGLEKESDMMNNLQKLVEKEIKGRHLLSSDKESEKYGSEDFDFKIGS